ncbi:SRPBCC family protein [Paracoccus sp. S1E-3]|uniref:SRPBCC family protein n=1 Tax=Paracoccus sp. S1E-3 TaxID=2756130 RepID=UPI0015EF7956|nr:SRPBCC family protein [Paracoccus sp. S1E-3]MBA4490509.1 SRPBCC family protein [Paracoccus sp. S1E-3]
MSEVSPRPPLIGLRVLLALAVAVIYGLAIYAIAWLPRGDGAMVVISGAFLLAAGVGSLMTVLVDPRGERSFGQLLGYAAVALLIVAILTIMLFIEGIICIIMAIPILLPGVSIGIAFAQIVLGWWQNRYGAFMMAALPLLVLPLEVRMDWPDYQGFVSTEIVIAAPPETVWANTVEIRDIDPATLRFTPSHGLMFFPRPLDARLDRAGAGATRSLEWTGGIRFREHINVWEENRRLGWTFGFDPHSIPAEIDSHLRPDTEASELLRGDYVLEPLADGRTRLVLTTYYKVSLPWNGYGRIWANRLLTDFHSVVLDVVRQRSEAAAQVAAAPRPTARIRSGPA